MKDLINIKNIEKNIIDGRFTPVFFNDINLAMKFEKKLFDRGIRWPGHEEETEYVSFIKNHFNVQMIMDINYRTSNIITQSYKYDVYVHKNKDNVIMGTKYFVDNIFVKSPTYKPKKITRIL